MSELSIPLSRVGVEYGVGLPPGITDLQAKLQDREWRLRSLYWVKDDAGQRVLFKPNWAQQHLYDDLGPRNLSLKVRQIGITTAYCILWLDTALFSNDFKAGIIAHTKGDASKIFREKVLFPYECLPDEIRAQIPVRAQNKSEIIFEHGSEISVDVSYRSGTVNVLHVTEYGYICAHTPHRAEEIKTGAFPAAQAGIIVVEATAKGRTGDFKTMVDEARKGNEWRFNFLPWWKHPKYTYKPTVITDHEGNETVDDPPFAERRDPEGLYLDKLEKEIGQQLTRGQRRWWCLKYREQGDKVWSEFPSTPEEAFRASTEGSYYGAQVLDAWQNGRITIIPIEKGLAVETWWDIGMSDSTAIWFVQRYGREIRVVDYYENSGEGLSHYKGYLDDWAKKWGVRFNKAAGPHDLKVRDWTGEGETRLEAAAKMGLHFRVAPDLPIVDGIDAVRRALPLCVFDEERCAKGIEALESYRKEWNETLLTWHDRPLHDWSEHGSSAFRYGVLCMNDAPLVPQAQRSAARTIVPVRWK